MSNDKKGFVVGAAFLTIIATLLSLASLATEEWVVARGKFRNEIGIEPSIIKYGLFSGVLVQHLGTVTTYEIKITCLVSKNVCAYLCQSTSERRTQELLALYHGEEVQFNSMCPGIRRENDILISNRHTYVFGDDNMREFINAGLYISTVVFLSIAIIFGVISSILLLWNSFGNPIEAYFSIYGIYVYNCLAFFSIVATVILWGILFGTVVVRNVGILYTIIGEMITYGLTDLGYSYWILLPSCFAHLLSIALLGLRQYLMDEDSKLAARRQDASQIMIN